MSLNILVLSDLHLEFNSSAEQREFIMSLDPENVDVLVLAGDICLHKQIIDVMSFICKRFSDSDVIWVHGNHEYYTTDRATVVAKTKQALLQNKNLHWLDGNDVTIKGQRFLGATMWFRDHPLNALHESMLNDFRVINGFEQWLYSENERMVKYISDNVQPDDVVITHHLPLMSSIAARFNNNDLNRFYLCDMSDVIFDHGPKLWIHGHTHDSLDYKIEHKGNSNRVTRIVCNPRGYYHEENPEFNKAFVVEV